MSFDPPPNPTGKGYVYSPELIRAVRVALATERPLLLRGTPGCGKTTLARDIAEKLGADYYQEVVTSRTEARDLEWRFDSLLRLADAQLQTRRDRVAEPANYVEPRALWWGFDPESARTRGGSVDTPASDPLMKGSTDTPAPAPQKGSVGTPGPDAAPAPQKGSADAAAPYPLKSSSAARPAVVLIDEIDKADPEVANDLLEPFDVGTFRVAETGAEVARRRPVFLVVTTNDERDLPAAFIRRCVVHTLERPPREMLVRIAHSHRGTAMDDAVVLEMIELLEALDRDARELRLRAPGTAEFLDALKACAVLGVGVKSEEWQAIARIAMWKHGSRREAGG